MTLAVRTTGERAPEVRHRPASAPDAFARELVTAVPDATWDRGLQAAAERILASASGPRPRLDTRSTSQATSMVGFPGQARFSTILNGGAFPTALVGPVVGDARGGAVDVALARRVWGDGSTLWVVAWAPHPVDLNPVPRDLPLDGNLSVTVHANDGEELRLLLAPPDSVVEEVALAPGITRQLDRFHTPGEYRVEVLRRTGPSTQVALLFSVFVDQPPKDALPGARPSAEPTPDPLSAEAALLEAVNALRRSRGLGPVAPFPLFLPLAREHSAFMAASGVVAHSIQSQTPGVEAKAGEMAHPRARHFENVAAAATADEALARVVDSPGHLRNLLCEACTHVAIGAALEPVLVRPPRLFVTFELLEFPQGPPRMIEHYNR
jgi:uncharacterized protein YkwD